jgi:hypothetical protein
MGAATCSSSTTDTAETLPGLSVEQAAVEPPTSSTIMSLRRWAWCCAAGALRCISLLACCKLPTRCLLLWPRYHDGAVRGASMAPLASDRSRELSLPRCTHASTEDFSAASGLAGAFSRKSADWRSPETREGLTHPGSETLDLLRQVARSVLFVSCSQQPILLSPSPSAAHSVHRSRCEPGRRESYISFRRPQQRDFQLAGRQQLRTNQP